MFLRIAALLALIWLPFDGAGAQPRGSLDDLIEPVAGRTACFRRDYDAMHLKRRQRQATASIALWLHYRAHDANPNIMLESGLGIVRRGERGALFSHGSCEWDARANRDTSGRRLMREFPRDAAAVCLQSARPDVFREVSAEEGGALLFDRGKDRNTVMLYIGDRMTMVRRANRADQLDIRFGRDDRVFMLRRAAEKDCDFVKEAVTTPEPGVRRH